MVWPRRTNCYSPSPKQTWHRRTFRLLTSTTISCFNLFLIFWGSILNIHVNHNTRQIYSSHKRTDPLGKDSNMQKYFEKNNIFILCILIVMLISFQCTESSGNHMWSFDWILEKLRGSHINFAQVKCWSIDVFDPGVQNKCSCLQRFWAFPNASFLLRDYISHLFFNTQL